MAGRERPRAYEKARVAEELAKLAEGAVIPEWLPDYAVLREQARSC